MDDSVGLTLSREIYSLLPLSPTGSSASLPTMSNLTSADIETLSSIGQDTIQTTVALVVESVLWSEYHSSPFDVSSTIWLIR